MHHQRVHHGPGSVVHFAGHIGRGSDQFQTLGLVPTEPPIPARGRSESHSADRVADRERGPHRDGDVVVLGIEHREPLQLLSAAQMRFGGLGQLGEIREVRAAGRIRITRLREPILGILLDRLQHSVAGAANHDQQRFVGECREQLEHLPRFAPTDLLGRRQTHPAGEHRKPAQRPLFGIGEQLPTPVHHRTQGAVLRDRGAAATGEQTEPIVEPLGELVE